MNSGLRGLAVCCVVVVLCALRVRAERDDVADVVAAVRTADDARVAATLARDQAGLEAVLSNLLSYGHSNGRIETRASLIEALTSGRLAYTRIEYPERSFAVLSPDAVIMRGRVGMDARLGDQAAVLDLAFLAVWHREAGAWRLVAWQSCRVPPAVGGESRDGVSSQSRSP